jgi:prepilin-type N-terminal cleavage/methylation domain-containing protein
MKIKKLFNNNGFTLVELMVSVAIFALIIGPLIHAFITAGSTSRRSHILGDATLAYNNIVETIRANGAGYIIKGENPFTTGILTPTDDPNVFNITDYESGGSFFDIRLTFDETEFPEVNSRENTIYSSMQGVFPQPASPNENPDILAENYFKSQMESDDLESENFNRKINLIVSEEDGATIITAVYEYSYYNYPATISFSYHVYRGTHSEANIFIFYKPFYHGDADTIDIDNSEYGKNLSFFIVKQPTDDDILERDMNYTAVINLREPLGEQTTRIFSNFNEDMGRTYPNNILIQCILRVYKGDSDVPMFGEDVNNNYLDRLVSRQTRDRMFEVKIDIIRRGELENFEDLEENQESTRGVLLLTNYASQLD